MKKLLVLSILVMSTVVFAKGLSAKNVVDALALANVADAAEFLKSGNRTTSITYKAVNADQEIYTMVRQNCSSTGTAPTQCIGGARIQITLDAVIMMANRYKVGSSSILYIK